MTKTLRIVRKTRVYLDIDGDAYDVLGEPTEAQMPRLLLHPGLTMGQGAEIDEIAGKDVQRRGMLITAAMIAAVEGDWRWVDGFDETPALSDDIEERIALVLRLPQSAGNEISRVYVEKSNITEQERKK